MSEVAASRSSASRGRGSGRGGRGGFAGRGGRRPNGDNKLDTNSTDAPSAFEDEGDIGELRKLYGDKTSIIREMFPDWSEIDVLFALQETNGDQEEAVTRIAEGNISQWGDVSKAKKTSKPKAKEPLATTNESSSNTLGARPTRGGRGGAEAARGRGRATERGGRGGSRGRPSAVPATTNGSRLKENQPLSIPTQESSAWAATGDHPKAESTQSQHSVTDQSTPAETEQPSAPQAKTWASMLRQSTAPKPATKPKDAPPPPVETPVEAPIEAVTAAEPTVTEPEPEPVVPQEESTPVAEPAVPEPTLVVEPEVVLTPSQDELTKINLEQVADDSKPPATHTAASTTADSWDPRQNQASTNATPLSAAQQQHQAQRASSGYAASAIKATERTARTPTYQRRVLDQEEAVRMPGNRAVDSTAVQFGAFNLGGADEDIDGDREDPETRAQPPADSPVSHPRASLPPVAQAGSVSEQKPAPAGPSAAAPAGAPGLIPQPLASAQIPAAQNQQYSRFGQQAPVQEAPGAQHKPLDPFNQQNTPSSQPPFDAYPAQSSQSQSQQPGGPFSSGPSDYSSYYTANERNPYNYYGQHFGQQQGAQGQDNAPSQQRPFGSYGASQQNDTMGQFPQSGAAAHNQPRFGAGSNDAQNSGHSTPNPTTQAQQQQQQGAPGSQPQSHGQGYPGYNHPYYTNPYYGHYYSGYGQGGFGGPYGGKGGVYGQPYGVSPNAPFDHSQNSPASYAQSTLHRESGLGSGLGEYGRAASGQAGGAPGLGGSSFGSTHDSFARGTSSFQSQGQGFSSQAQPGNAASNDDLKPFGESKTGSGPSPSMGGARPGSATASNNAQAGQSGLPPPQTSQMGAGAYAGYPSHLQGHGLHGSSGYGMSGASGANQHGNTPYGSYGQGGFSSQAYYGGGQGQGQQQQRGGWGGNYH